MTFEQIMLLVLVGIILSLIWINQREFQANRREREMILRLLKAESLREYDDAKQPIGKRRNWYHDSLERSKRNHEREAGDE